MTALLDRAPVIVRSRLRPPDAHPDELPRPRLLARLDAFTEPVILLAAPRGSGKTVVLAQWVRSLGGRCAWVRLGPATAGLFDVWSAVLQALGPLCDTRGPSALPGCADPQTLFDRVIPELLNDLTAADPVVLVLDGLDTVVDPRAKESLTHFVLQLPAHVQTVLSTNRPAGGPIAVLRADGRLAEIGPDELRFTVPEARELLAVVTRRAVTEQEAARVHCGVDGWAVGLRLAGLALRHGPGGAVPREVLDFVRAEVLDRTAPRERAAIVQTSVLRELRPSWVNAVTGTWATRALASFARSSLFLQPADDGWVCHAALRAAAADELSRSEPELRRMLHERARDLFVGDGDLLGAAEHALEAGKLCEASDLVAGAWPAAHPDDLLEQVGRLGAKLSTPALSAGAAAALARGDAGLAVRLSSDAGCGADAVRALAFLQLGELTKARVCLETSRTADPPGSWCAVVAQLVGGLVELWEGRVEPAAALLEGAAADAAGMDYRDAMVRSLDGIVACASLRGDDDTARDAALRNVAVYLQDPRRATFPVIAVTYLELLGHRTPVPTDPTPPAGGPHPAAFAETLRAAAARTEDQWVTYRLAQSRGRSLLSVEQAGPLLRYLLEDQPTARPGSTADEQARLSNRELVVLKALSGPLTLREIAREFHVSHNTIKTQVRSLFRKLGAHDRAGAVDAARERGLIPRA
ncbi:LuxR C-terminal-related transcriptional regulator [Mycolicibacterium sp.]|uniref:helix-turn-helix transcriptional regulator n=1 Tax=Mycolicibacterium sp. TaxID=2320850 RepID=UPI003D141D31